MMRHDVDPDDAVATDAWTELCIDLGSTGYEELVLESIGLLVGSAGPGEPVSRIFFARERRGTKWQLRVWIDPNAARLPELVGRLRSAGMRASPPHELRVIHPSCPETGPYGGPAAPELLAALLCAACPLQVEQLEAITAGRQRRVTIALDIMVATLLAIDIASAFPERYPSAVAASGFPAAFAVYRSHADGFILMSVDPTATRAQLDARYEEHGPRIRHRVAAVLAQLAHGPVVSDIAARWYATTRPFLVRAEAAVRAGRLTFADEHGTFGEDLELGGSSFHRAARASPELRAFRRQDSGLRATRPIMSATYVALGGLGLELVERCFLCHAISRACEELFGLDAVRTVRALPNATLPRARMVASAREALAWDEQLGAWRARGLAVCRRILTDPHLETTSHAGVRPSGWDRPDPAEFLGSWFSRRDAAEHLDIRRRLAAPLSAHALADLGPMLDHVAREHASPLSGSLDLVDGFLRPYWIDATTRMLRLPPGQAPRVLTVITALATVLQRPRLDVRAARAVEHSMDYLHRLLLHLLASPEPAPLVRALGELTAAGSALGPWDAVAALAQLLTAGLQPTLTSAALAWSTLAGDPELQAAVAADCSTLAALIDELVRLDPPFPFLHRWARHPCDCHGQHLEPGVHVIVDVRAANRDPSALDRPDRVVAGRRGGAGLSFGHGTHTCMGAALARLQIQAALRALLSLEPPLQALDASVVRGGHLVVVRSLRCRRPTPELTTHGSSTGASTESKGAR